MGYCDITPIRSTNALFDVYDACEAQLRRDGAGAALHELAAQLQRVRLTTPEAEWRRMTVVRSHPLFERLAQDPYTAQALTKPRGYAGDAHTLDFVYGQRGAEEAATPEGRELCAISTNIPVAVALRARCDFVARAIQSRLLKQPAATVVSVACGHMRELHLVSQDLRQEATIIGVDGDAETIETLPMLHSPNCPERRVATLRGIVAGQVALPPADLIYASGLYDYLPDAMAAQLTARLAGFLEPGGQLLVPTLTPSSGDAGYLEAVMDWWMIYRSESDLERLIPTGIPASHELSATCHSVADGRLACLELARG